MIPKQEKNYGLSTVSCFLPTIAGHRVPGLLLQSTRHANLGLTLIELLVGMGLFAFLCTLTASNMISWRNQARMNDASMKMLSVYQNARMLAVKENAPVLVSLDSTANSYTVFSDDKIAVLRGTLPPGVYVDRVTRETVGFDSRGIPHFGTTVTLTDRGGRRTRVVVSPSGHSRVERDR